MYMYTKIHNPLTNRYVKINSKIGKNILRRYLEIMGGNPYNSSVPSWEQRAAEAAAAREAERQAREAERQARDAYRPPSIHAFRRAMEGGGNSGHSYY